MNLGARLPNAAEHLPAVVPALGTPPSRTAQDAWDHEILRAACAAFAREVRRYDTYRMIDTGDGLPRPSAWHNRTEHTWTADTPAQQAQMLQADHPDPVSARGARAAGAEPGRVPLSAGGPRKGGGPAGRRLGL